MSLHSIEALQADAQGALTSAHEALADAAKAEGSRAEELRARGLAKLRAAREALLNARDSAVEQGRQTARAADDLVHAHPWQVVGGALVAGVVAGMVAGVLLQRRR